MFRNAMTPYIKLDLPAPLAPVSTVIGLISRSLWATERKFRITKRICALPAMFAFALRYSSSERFTNPLRTFTGSQIPSNVLGSLFLAHCFEHGLIDSLRFFGESQMLEHHGHRGDGADRISHIFSGEWRGRPMDRLKHR